MHGSQALYADSEAWSGDLMLPSPFFVSFVFFVVQKLGLLPTTKNTKDTKKGDGFQVNRRARPLVMNLPMYQRLLGMPNAFSMARVQGNLPSFTSATCPSR
jgi:hypothetical protein